MMMIWKGQVTEKATETISYSSLKSPPWWFPLVQIFFVEMQKGPSQPLPLPIAAEPSFSGEKTRPEEEERTGSPSPSRKLRTDTHEVEALSFVKQWREKEEREA